MVLEPLIAAFKSLCATFPDLRRGENTVYDMADIGMGAFATFFMQSPSVLAQQMALERGRGTSNCQTLFQMARIPSDNCVRGLLDPVRPEQLFPMFSVMLAALVAPDKAAVLCVDEKSQIQALYRTQPGLPRTKGRAEAMTHDCKRHGTTTLFAALDVKTGQVIGECLPKHRAKEFIRFLKTIDPAVDKHLAIHAICNNYSAHKTPEVTAWLDKHPRFKLHFIPSSSSWLNLVERLFAEITRQRIRRGVFKSVDDLKAAIAAWIDCGANPKPFKWTARAAAILAKNDRARNSLEQVRAGTL